MTQGRTLRVQPWAVGYNAFGVKHFQRIHRVESTGKDLIRRLRQNGWLLIREGRRHSWVPRHTEIPDPLARKICRDLGIPEV